MGKLISNGSVIGQPFAADIAGQTTVAGAGVPDHSPVGWYGQFIGSTPKYARNVGPLQDDREKVARMLIPVGPAEYATYCQAIAQADPDALPLVAVLAGDPSGTSGGMGYIDFQLQSVQHGLQEKVQITELLSDNYVAYFFGQGAPQFNFSGTLLNTFQDDQLINMLRIYTSMIRGSQLAKYRKVVKLRFNGMVIGGAALNLNWQLDAAGETGVPFNFTLLVKSLNLLPNPNYGIVTLKEPFAAGFPNTTGDAADQYGMPVVTTILPAPAPAAGSSIVGSMTSTSAGNTFTPSDGSIP